MNRSIAYCSVCNGEGCESCDQTGFCLDCDTGLVCLKHCRKYCGHKLTYVLNGGVDGDPIWVCDECDYFWNFDVRLRLMGDNYD